MDRDEEKIKLPNVIPSRELGEEEKRREACKRRSPYEYPKLLKCPCEVKVFCCFLDIPGDKWLGEGGASRFRHK
jgi:hypothetical protein